MVSRLDISITAPFAVGDLVARVDLEDGRQVRVVLREGRFRAELSGRAIRITLTTDPPPQSEAPLSVPPLDSAGRPEGKAIDVYTLFKEGCEIPEDGCLKLQILWAAPCHDERLEDAPEGKRFSSGEHIACAKYIGLDSVSGNASHLTFNGIYAQFTEATALPVGQKQLTFGEIMCLAGDFYAHLDPIAVSDFDWAWPALSGMGLWLGGDYRKTTLTADSGENVRNLLDIIRRDQDEKRSGTGEFIIAAIDTVVSNYPARRYLALASQNCCHFGCPGPGMNDTSNPALRLYRSYHTRALQEAHRSRNAANSYMGLLKAVATDAFGCHFLTDLFASGHIRVPRRLLGERYGVIRGALQMSRSMHDEDNRLGFWCTTRLPQMGTQRIVWRAYGDGMLRNEVASQHILQVQEAVRRSAAEVFAAYCGVQLPEMERAEAILPVPLAPGEAPGSRDVLPDKTPAPMNHNPNHWPLYWVLSDGSIVRRVGQPNENWYCDQDAPDPRSFKRVEALA